MNTTENNKLIAEFLELQLEQDQERLFISGLGTKLINETFNTDWDWLMKAVEKIESIKLDKVSFGLIIEKNSVTIYYCHETEPKKRVDLFFEWGQKTKIGNTYKIVCSFIEWYNKQTA